MRPGFRYLKLLVITVTGGCLLASASCMTKQFATDLATNAARDLADIVIDALLLDPVDDALNAEE